MVQLDVSVNKETVGYWRPSTKLPKEFRPPTDEWPCFPALLINFQQGSVFDHVAMVEVHDTGEVVVGVAASITYGQVRGWFTYKARN